MAHTAPRYLQLELILAYVAKAMRENARLLAIKGSGALIVAAANEHEPFEEDGELLILESEVPCLSIWEEKAVRKERGTLSEEIDVKLMWVDRFDAGGVDIPMHAWGRRWAKEARWVAFQALGQGEAKLSDGSTIKICPSGAPEVIELVQWVGSETFCAVRKEDGDGFCGWEADLKVWHGHPPYPLEDPPEFLKILFELHPGALAPDNTGPIVGGTVDLTEEGD